MVSLAWGGLRNGILDQSRLSTIDGIGHQMETTAAYQFKTMVKACWEETGIVITPAPNVDSCFRTFSQQQFYWTRYVNRQPGWTVAAIPGTSNHGWARAVDITGYETPTGGWSGGVYRNGGSVWGWLMAHEAQFGFSWATGKFSTEAWHHECLTAPGSLNSKVTAAGGIDEIGLGSMYKDDPDLQARFAQVVAFFDGQHKEAMARIDQVVAFFNADTKQILVNQKDDATEASVQEAIRVGNATWSNTQTHPIRVDTAALDAALKSMGATTAVAAQITAQVASGDLSKLPPQVAAAITKG